MTVQVEALTYEALKAQCDALADRVNALAVSCSLYREAISKARRLINVDEMGDADDVLAQAERELSSHDAALAAIRNEATARALKHLCDCQLISATVAELKADELRESK
ncbi:hypothetical protein ACTWOG_001667 [Serratia marcescens]